MRYMLFHQHTKPGVPVKRQELISLISAGYRGSSKKKLGNLIITKAQDKFITICGLELKEVTPQLHGRQGLALPHTARPSSASSAFCGSEVYSFNV